MANAREIGWNLSCRRWLDEGQQRQQHKMSDILLLRKLADSGPNRNFKNLCEAKIPPEIDLWLWMIIVIALGLDNLDSAS